MPSNLQSATTAPSLRPLATTWLIASAPVGAAAFVLALVSDHSSDRVPGTVLGLLALSGVALATWMIVDPRREALAASLVASAASVIAAAVVYPTQEFTADAVWSSGAPAAAALVTAAIAFRSLRTWSKVGGPMLIDPDAEGRE